jgi:Fic family protein
VSTIPNKHILLNAVTINEAKDSAAIENIITTHDELYQAMSQSRHKNPATKEVVNYRSALWYGYEQVKQREILTTNMIINIHAHIENNRSGIRKLPGTVLRNGTTGETIYTPPSGEQEIRKLMATLEKYMNEDFDGIDPLIKLPLSTISLRVFILSMMETADRSHRKCMVSHPERSVGQPHPIFEPLYYSL